MPHDEEPSPAEAAGVLALFDSIRDGSKQTKSGLSVASSSVTRSAPPAVSPVARPRGLTWRARSAIADAKRLPAASHQRANRGPRLRSVGFGRLLVYFLELGTLGFGGPIATVGYMQRDLVEQSIEQHRRRPGCPGSARQSRAREVLWRYKAAALVLRPGD